MDAVAIFPGQGSQAVGMLAELAAAHKTVRATFDEASAALGEDLWSLVAEGPVERLDQTRWTQPAMLAADIAVWRVYRALGGATPLAMAGHSLGEYAALVAADAIAFDDAVRVVHRRGSVMQAAVAEGEGAMAAILGLEDAQVERICADHPGAVAANYNSPGQLVIAGSRAAVEAAAAQCLEAGARRALLLPVSVPAHSPLMAAAEVGLREALDAVELRAPRIEVLHNADLRAHAEPDAIRSALVRQLTHPVPWTRTIQVLLERGAGRFLECGPGRVLCGLGRRIQRDAEWLALESGPGLIAALGHPETETQS
ncbi:MAG: [acyl-carrier-protein] S-malonyltransferase [Gammaproteobacteria bacterium HGW-Gammaproteobacteria-8]|nr:MAG: [acyl-carrier-protein] S-malonyltransferase [Gammaproteobacteria bacterium HGW-Gammaproteobacteria-8]